MTATLATAAHEQYLEALRLLDVAKQHYVKMLAESADPDLRVQRGNAAAYAHCESRAIGIACALRAFGHDDYADRIEYAAHEADTSLVSREPVTA